MNSYNEPFLEPSKAVKFLRSKGLLRKNKKKRKKKVAIIKEDRRIIKKTHNDVHND